MADRPPRRSITEGGAQPDAPPEEARWSAADDLPELVDESDARTGEVPQLRLGDVATTTSVAVVREAVQLPIRRRVAVKIPLREGDVDALVGEARIAASLEHPNVVPIHLLGRDQRGRPLLVMKLIEGEPWQDQLDEADRIERLRHHLGILMQVCNAIGLAHERRIIHRDLKPSNIMIGPFGEIYVVDWGLAMRIDDDATPLPRARDVRERRGTAAYMAPEMLAGDGRRLGPESDVYLLGGMLHTILTGEAPFEGFTMSRRLADPEARPPKRIGAEVPAELAAICRRALAPVPTDRHPSAQEFRHALAEALHHLGSLELSAAADARLMPN